jgi:hypothetical protein
MKKIISNGDVMSITELFTDEKIIIKIQEKLPKLFYIAEQDSSRAGKIGMEVGSLREKILIALIIYKFGAENVNTDIPITAPESDVELNGKAISIKTLTGRIYSGLKLAWTVDEEVALRFMNNYVPSCDIIFAQIIWDNYGYLFLFPLKLQQELFQRLGRNQYIKLPKPGTNPRGVEMSSSALQTLASSPDALKIKIEWKKQRVSYDPYKRWLELWED